VEEALVVMIGVAGDNLGEAQSRQVKCFVDQGRAANAGEDLPDRRPSEALQ
jgi:hypothetical protein